MATTEYVVLQVAESATGSVSSPNGRAASWSEIGRASAPSAKAAVAAVVNKDELEGMFMAVPARSWSPITVKREVKLSFS